MFLIVFFLFVDELQHRLDAVSDLGKLDIFLENMEPDLAIDNKCIHRLDEVDLISGVFIKTVFSIIKVLKLSFVVLIAQENLDRFFDANTDQPVVNSRVQKRIRLHHFSRSTPVTSIFLEGTRLRISESRTL